MRKPPYLVKKRTCMTLHIRFWGISDACTRRTEAVVMPQVPLGIAPVRFSDSTSPALAGISVSVGTSQAGVDHEPT